MTALKSRKQLLVAESELNRALLRQDWQTLAEEAGALARQAGTIRSMVSAAAALAAGLASCRRAAAAPAAAKAPWWRTLLKGAGLVGSFWSEMRKPGRTHQNAEGGESDR
jgi:hypothetical protein